MQPATPAQLAALTEHLAAIDTWESAVLRTLSLNPGTWYHVALNDVKVNGNLDAQIEALEAEATGRGYSIATVILNGRPEGGFFARV